MRGTITIEQALAIPEVRRGEPFVVAGRGRLDRPVRWVHCCETAKVARLLTGGELLFSTAGAIGERPQQQRTFVRDLSERGVAGLVVEPGQALGDLPVALIAEADRHSLPLVGLRKEVSVVQITEALHREILARYYTDLERRTEINDELDELVLGGGGVDEILGALAAALGNPVVLEGRGGEFLAHADVRPTDTRAVELWQALGGEFGDRAGDVLREPVPGAGAEEPRGHLSILPLEHEPQKLDLVVLRRSARLIGLILQREHHDQELLLRNRGNFLYDVIEGGIDPEGAAGTARCFGFEPRGQIIPAVIRFGGTDAARRGSSWMDLGRQLSKELAGRSMRVLVGVRPAAGEVLLVVDEGRGTGSRAQIAERIAEVSREVADRQMPGEPPSVGVGGSGDWAAVSLGLRDASMAAQAGERLDHRPWHDASQPDLERLLWLLRDNEALRSFVAHHLEPVLDHDRTTKHKLMPTLEAFCRHGGRKTLAANELFLARQALYNRLRKISALLDRDISQPEVLAGTNIAVTAARFMQLY